LKRFAVPGESPETEGDGNMNQQNVLIGDLLRRFFHRFRHITYQGVPICKFIYLDLISNWKKTCLQINPFGPAERVDDRQVYDWSDAPYPYEAHPNGVVLMRGGFGDIAAAFLPPERIFLISPSQAEVDLIKLNRPDLISHNIADYYRDNPRAIEELNTRITQVIRKQGDDPLLGSLDFLDWFKSRIPQVVRILDAVQSLFATIKVSAVLTVSSVYSMDGALNLVARAHRIPSFTLQHGLMAENDLFHHVPILATKKMVWGDAIRDWYRKYGFPESRVSVIGSPRFDIIFSRKWCGKEQLCRMLDIDPAKKVIVYGAAILRIDQVIVPIILEGLKSIPDIFLVMLQHPGDDPVPHEKLAEGYTGGGKVVRFGHISLYDALSGADCFITCYSTSALEAMLFKLPVITVEPTPPTFSFGDLGASLKVTDAAGLNQAVRRLLADPGFRSETVDCYRHFLSQYCIPDGLAAKRLFDEVESMCRTGGTA
jgi:hypothetical protein